MAAQGYQESTLDQSARNASGAIGVMQVLPTTAKDLKVGDITKLEPNIHAGVKYMRSGRWMDTFYKDANPIGSARNKGLMTFCGASTTPDPGGSGSSGARRKSAASIPTSGSATSSASRPHGSAARP